MFEHEYVIIIWRERNSPLILQYKLSALYQKLNATKKTKNQMTQLKYRFTYFKRDETESKIYLEAPGIIWNK